MNRKQKIDALCSSMYHLYRGLVEVRGLKDDSVRKGWDRGLTVEDAVECCVKAIFTSTPAGCAVEADHNVSKSYKYPVRFTRITAVVEGSNVRYTLKRTSTWGHDKDAVVTGLIPVEVLSLNPKFDCLLDGDLFALSRGGKSRERFDAKGACTGWSVPLPESLVSRLYGKWEHAVTRSACGPEIERKIAALQAAKSEAEFREAERVRDARIAKRNDRRAALLARLSTQIVARYADAREVGFCDAGIKAWAADRGINLTSSVPLYVLSHDPSRSAQALALQLARRALRGPVAP